MRRRQAFAQRAEKHRREEPVRTAKCASCGRTFASDHGLKIHQGRGCK